MLGRDQLAELVCRTKPLQVLSDLEASLPSSCSSLTSFNFACFFVSLQSLLNHFSLYLSLFLRFILEGEIESERESERKKERTPSFQGILYLSWVHSHFTFGFVPGRFWRPPSFCNQIDKEKELLRRLPMDPVQVKYFKYLCTHAVFSRTYIYTHTHEPRHFPMGPGVFFCRCDLRFFYRNDLRAKTLLLQVPCLFKLW